MVGHARLACDEAGHWITRLARAEQVGRRGEVKVAASEDRALSESVRARGKRKCMSLAHKRVSGFYSLCNKVNGLLEGREPSRRPHELGRAADRPECVI